ncbi:MAG: DUF2877 domain-containing protein [Anaerolineae bacterium]|nr:DUF2877 domain-containing protein [Anaerolineae bacterium]MCI0608065.1 DUF2877 domain-containing protein [Anaerolineae bacterium]
MCYRKRWLEIGHIFMQFNAVSIGSAVPQDDFDAVIQSVFDSSVNLRLAHENRLITVLISDQYELPQGIRLDVKNAPLQSLTVGLHAACRGGILRFDSSPLSINLRGASIWEAQLPIIDITKPIIKQAWSITWQALNRQQRLKQTDLIADDLFQSDKGSLLTRKLSQSVLDLLPATKRFDIEASVEAARKMIGLGPGVTPAGDDILIGYLAGLWSTAGEDKEKSAFIESFGKALLQLADQTNEISRTYLYHAIHGQFSGSLINLVNAIVSGEKEQLLSTAKDALRVGHSSGMDSVTGLLISLAVWGSHLASYLTPPSSLSSDFSSRFTV